MIMLDANLKYQCHRLCVQKWAEQRLHSWHMQCLCSYKFPFLAVHDIFHLYPTPRDAKQPVCMISNHCSIFCISLMVFITTFQCDLKAVCAVIVKSQVAGVEGVSFALFPQSSVMCVFF